MVPDFQKILEFHDLFPEEKDLDVKAVLKSYNRLTIVKIVAVLGHSYGNASIPDSSKTFFSKASKKYIDDLNDRISKVLKEYKISKIFYSTIRTSLELIRITFSIPVEEYRNDGNEENLEYDMFRVILMLNEKLMSSSKKGELNFDEIIYFNQFISNDMNNCNISNVYRTQTYYSDILFKYLEKNYTDLLDKLLKEWQIDQYQDYVRSLMFLFFCMNKKKNKIFKSALS